MKKYPKIVQIDSRGQIVIPKDIRTELGIDEGSGFYCYTITDEGIFLKKIEAKELGEHGQEIEEIKGKAKQLGIAKKNVEKSVKNYEKKKTGRLEVVR